MRPLLTLVLVLALAAPAAADPPGPLSEPVYDQSVTEEFRVPTKHGSIYGWVTRPVVPEGVKVPVLLTYSPYHAEDSPIPGMEGGETLGFFVPRGYARAIVHLVGTGNSGGCYDYGGIREQETAHDVVEYLGTREWTNGRVGMLGVSYDGTTQWAAAVTAPPHLVTIIPQAAISRWYHYAFQQGVRQLAGWGTPVGFDFGWAQIPSPHTNPDPQALSDNVRPCDEIEHNQRGFLPDPVYDEFWLERDYVIRAQNIKASVLVEHGWQDYNVHTVNAAQMWEALPAAVDKRLSAGQFGHRPADFEYAEEIRHAWLDHHLLGYADALATWPRVLSETADRDVRGSHEWPLRGTQLRSFRLGGPPAPETLSLVNEEEPTWRDTSPTLSEDDVMAGGADAESVLFLGEPLAAETRIAGTPVLDATVTTSEQETFLTPTLFVEAPDGSRTFITRGTLNSRNRDGDDRSEPFAPGATWRGRVRFQPLDRLLEAGSRIGLALMSMNSNEVLYPDTTRATNELDLGASKLELPIAPRPRRLRPQRPRGRCLRRGRASPGHSRASSAPAAPAAACSCACAALRARGARCAHASCGAPSVPGAP